MVAVRAGPVASGSASMLMGQMENATLTIAVDAQRSVAALDTMPPCPSARIVLAHGAGAGMRHPFLAAVADGLAARGIATFRFQFPFAEAGAKRPDPPRIAQATVRAAVDQARALSPDLPLFAAGKSFGGRMTSSAQATAALPGLCGIVFFGFPLHPAGRPATERADHLRAVDLPMLFHQGTRDPLAEIELIQPIVDQLGSRATLNIVREADHSFRVPVRSGLNNGDVLAAMLDRTAQWVAARIGQTAG